MRKLLALAFGSAALAACGGDDSSSGSIPDACNPLGGEGCLLPWPSATYLTAAATTASGYRISIPIEGMPVNNNGDAIDPVQLSRADGFSPTGPLLAMFPAGVS